MTMASRVYRVGSKDSSFQLSTMKDLDTFGAPKTSNIGWLSVPSASKVCISLVVRNASVDLDCAVSAKVSGIDPNNPQVADLVLLGVDYGGRVDGITTDGEYILDIVDTACPFIDPEVELSAGSATFSFVLSGKD